MRFNVVQVQLILYDQQFNYPENPYWVSENTKESEI
jgi:hypothetical protein